MDEIKVKNIFAAVSDKSILAPLLDSLKARPSGRKPFRLKPWKTERPGLDGFDVKFLGTQGTVDYLKSKGFDAKSVVFGFDFDGILSDSKGGFNPFAGSGKPAARDAYWHGQLRPDKNGRLPAQKARYLSLYKKLLAFLQAHPNLNNKKRRRLLALMDLCLAIAS